MHHRSRRSVAGLALLLFVLAALLGGVTGGTPAQAASPPSRVVYTVSIKSIPDKTFHVTAKAEGVSGPSVAFAIPAWTPGWYFLTSYAKDISNVSATGPGDAKLAVTPRDKLTWEVATGGGAKTVTLAYDVKASDRNFGFFYNYLDENNGFVHGPAALMYVVDGKTAPCSVTYKVPDGWKIASANDPVSGDPTTFTAKDYDTLADQPADLGNFKRVDRTVRGVPFSAVFVGVGNEDVNPFAENAFKIAAAGIDTFGGKAPFPRYIFHFRFNARGGGGGAGLEHLNSTTITLGSGALRRPNAVASLVAHEFVHAWNVKRVRSEKLGPFDYTQEVRTKELWFAEGVTEYFAPQVVVRAGLGDRNYWLGYMTGNITELQGTPGRLKYSAEDVSYKVWEAGNSQGFGGLSYYNKGMLVGLLLDAELRARTQNKVGINTLIQTLLADVQRTGRGFPEGGIDAAASKLTGTDMKPFFDRAVRSTEELPYAETLAKAGINFEEKGDSVPYMGVGFDFQNSSQTQLLVSDVYPGTAAEKAGLKVGDAVTAVDGQKIAQLRGNIIGDKKTGDPFTLTIVRAGQEKTISGTVGTRKNATYRLTVNPNATDLQKAILAGMTGEGK